MLLPGVGEPSIDSSRVDIAGGRSSSGYFPRSSDRVRARSGSRSPRSSVADAGCSRGDVAPSRQRVQELDDGRRAGFDVANARGLGRDNNVGVEKEAHAPCLRYFLRAHRAKESAPPTG